MCAEHGNHSRLAMGLSARGYKFDSPFFLWLLLLLVPSHDHPAADLHQRPVAMTLVATWVSQ